MKKKEADLAKWENEIGSKEQAFKTAEEARFCTGLFPFFLNMFCLYSHRSSKLGKLCMVTAAVSRFWI